MPEPDREVERCVIFCKAMTNLAADFNSIGFHDEAKTHLFAMRDFINDRLPSQDPQAEDKA